MRESVDHAARVTVHPVEINDVLYNPGMGLADFHFGFDHPPTLEEHPPATVAYFRWSWAELEPEEGAYNFALVDRVIAQAKAKGETLAFRIMTEYEKGTPTWLFEKGIASVPVGGGRFPDYNDPVFLTYHEKLLEAFGARYGRSPAIDHIDIGSIGCWGEWNMACCQGVEAQCQTLFPSQQNQQKITDMYFQHFSGRPLVMLHGGLLSYAATRGAGWRGDCFGDYGYFGPEWNHMEHAYAPALQDPVVAHAWERGPVQFEVCGVMQDWFDKGFDIDLIFKKGLDWHVSVLNAKSSPVPPAWRSRLVEFLKRVGYRLVLRELSHPGAVKAGDRMRVSSTWENVGVAPPYHLWPLAYRLRSESDQIVAQWHSGVDVRRWLPERSHSVDDILEVPAGIPSGRYILEVGILSEGGDTPAVQLAIAGGRFDHWYSLSEIGVWR